MKLNEKWNNNYELLINYKKEHGNIDVPFDYEINGVKLGQWLAHKRVIYRGKSKGALTDEQIELLNNLGIKWELRNNLTWNDYYELLVNYKKEYGNIDVPKNYEINDIKLGLWLINQRTAYRGSKDRKISKEQIELLEELGVDWGTTYNDMWNRNYSLLVKYKEEYGNVDVPYYYTVDNVRLGIWVAYQRMAYSGSRHELSKERKDALDKLGMNWSVQESKWDYHYRLLKEYKEKYGNVDVPQKYEIDGVRLGVWVALQRLGYHNKQQNISQERIDALNELGMIWEKNKAFLWENHYELLKKYKEQYGDINVSQRYIMDGVKLGIWLTNQRELYKVNKLKNERIVKLNELDIDWSVNDTKILNSNMTDKEYQIILYKRLNNILRDLQLENRNEINNQEEQKEIEKVIIKRLFK